MSEVEAIFTSESGGAIVGGGAKATSNSEVFLRNVVDIAQKGPEGLALKIGLAQHPRWLLANEYKMRKEQKLQLLQQLFYNIDATSQLDPMSAAKKKRREAEKHKRRAVQWWHRHLGIEDVAKVPFQERIAKACMADHLTLKVEGGSCMYSLRATALPLPSILQVTRVNLDAAQRSHEVSLDGLELDVVLPVSARSSAQAPERFEGEQLGQSCALGDQTHRDSDEVVFFRIVCQNIGNVRNVPLPAAQSKRAKQTDMAVTLHKARSCSDGSWHVETIPARAAGVATTVGVLSVVNADIQHVQQSMQWWVMKKQMQYVMDGLPVAQAAEAENLIQSLVRSRAFQGSMQYFTSTDVKQLATLRALEEGGFVTATEQSELRGSSPQTATHQWQLTAQGTRSLRAVHHTLRGHRVFQHLADTTQKSLMGASNWQLLAALDSQGWVLRPLPTAKANKKLVLPPYAHGSAKTWYLSAQTQHLTGARQYVMCLLSADKLFEGGVVKAIHHGQKTKYYLNVLQEKISGEVKVECADDETQKRAAESMTLELDVAMDTPPCSETRRYVAKVPLQNTDAGCDDSPEASDDGSNGGHSVESVFSASDEARESEDDAARFPGLVAEMEVLQASLHSDTADAADVCMAVGAEALPDEDTNHAPIIRGLSGYLHTKSLLYTSVVAPQPPCDNPC